VASTGPARTAEDPILELRDATVSFDMERGQARVLDEVSLSVRRGEVLGIVGESGSGKSMCASSMLDAVVEPGRLTGEVIYHPKGGEPVDLLEVDAAELKRLRWEEIAFLVQAAQSAFNPTMTVKGHFTETLATHDYPVEEGLERGRELLEQLHLVPEQVLNSYPHELSGGMKQRALVALSLLLEPDVLVMDEPTSALDLLMQRSIVSLLNRLKDEYDLTMVFVTHDLPIVADVADRLAVMYAFEVVEVGPTETITGAAAHPYTRALIRSVPDVRAPLDRMEGIPGSSPDPVNVPTGCSYRTRCPLSDDWCEANDPTLTPIEGDEHVAACFYPEEARRTLPIGAPDEELGPDGDLRGSDGGGASE